MSLLTVKNLKFNYPQSTTFAVDDVSFEIEKGSYTAIVGFNGSGKSTVARILCGLENPVSGQVLFHEKTQLGIVFQSPKDQLVSGVVKRDTAFGPENLKLPAAEIELRTIESLNVVELLHKAESSTNALSLGQTQKAALAGMLAIEPDVLILDEAASMLDPDSRKEILEFLDYWHYKGNTIIQITHDLSVVKASEHVIGMENGRIFFDGTTDAFFASKENVRRIEGEPLLQTDKTILAEKQNKEISLSVKNINFSYDANNSILKNISFDLYKGTLTALTGASGAGKSTLLECCSGLLQTINDEKSGIFCADKEKPVLAQQNASAALFEAFAADDVAFGPGNKGISGKKLKTLVKECMDKAALPFEEFGERHTFELSGGEQRRLSIAGILAMNSSVVLFDEPTAGLDSKARFQVMNMMKALADEGKTVLFSTHKMDEAAFSDREIRIENGRIAFDTCGVMMNTRKNDGSVVSAASASLVPVQPYAAVSMLKSLKQSSLVMAGVENSRTKPFVQRWPSVIRILFFLAMFTASLCVKPVWACGLMLAASFIYGLLSGFSVKGYFNSCRKILPFLLIFAVLQLIFHPAMEGEVQFISWKYLTITPSKLWFCLASFLRTFAALGCIFAAYFSTPEYELIDGLSILLKPLALIRVPVRYFILIVEIMFRFIPLLVEEAEAIIKTQIMRGGLGKVKNKTEKLRALVPLFVPMIIRTIKRSEILADAITMRGFK